jgi:hypothetical protein
MRRLPPRTHPAPLASELWRHLEKIRACRRKKKTWQAIAKELQQTGGIKLTAGTVRNFFKRASRRVSHCPNDKPQARAASASLQKASTLFVQPQDPSFIPDDDPFSTKVIPFDPWKPQTKARAS